MVYLLSHGGTLKNDEFPVISIYANTVVPNPFPSGYKHNGKYLQTMGTRATSVSHAPPEVSDIEKETFL